MGQNSHAQVVVKEGNKSADLQVEVQCLEYCSFGLFVVGLSEGLIGIALIAVEVWNVFIEFTGFAGNDQGTAGPKLFMRVEMP